MKPTPRRIINTLAVLGLLLGLPTAALAIDIRFLSGLTDDISRLTHIDENVLNSGVQNLAAVQRIWKGEVQSGAVDLASANLGRLGIEDSTVGRIRSAAADGETLLDRGSGTTHADSQYRSKLLQQHVHRILSGQGQNQAGELLARSSGYREVAKKILDTQQTLSEDSLSEARKTNSAARDIGVKGRRAQRSRSSQDVLKTIASQNVDLGEQNNALSQQYGNLSASLAGLSTQLSAQSSQADLLNRQLASDQVAQAYQLQGLTEISQQLVALNQLSTVANQNNSAAVTHAATGVIIPQLDKVVEP